MAYSITSEIQQQHAKFQRALYTVENIKSAFCAAPPSVDAEPYQNLFENAFEDLLSEYDMLCGLLALDN